MKRLLMLVGIGVVAGAMYVAAAPGTQKGIPAKTAAASKTTELAKGIRETNKPQTSAHHQNQRRRSTASRGEARVPRWAARGAPGEYGGQGFARNFW